ncbi:MarR family winged helix-turn-helix transcriptional regulator [Acidimangrovimonas sediminis]|uniref:MarR family winged helix-turn-helix transcriptional regulator n=1 Tax=Acidimangrovimonas sediminis TaxID=2056283 RepID=UPI000C808D02|nr:MarR family transcriptional regulator [Acidimangrovimonas sediminis]
MQLETFFPYRLAVAAEAFSRNLVAVYGQNYGLTREEWRLLFLIEGAGRISSLELARRTTLGKVQVTRAAQRLEEKQMITRRVPKADRRLREYSITEEGRTLFAQAFDEVNARASEILGAMAPEDRAALDRGIEALMRAVRATTPEGVLAPDPEGGPEVGA